MGTLIPQTKVDVLAPDTYRVKLGALAAARKNAYAHLTRAGA